MNTKQSFNRRLLLSAGIAATLCVSPAALPAQNTPPSSGTTLHAETRVVLVDAVATDKKGKFARDLTEKNFKLWEDGKEQQITSFSLESAGVSPERSKKHYIAMFFDTSTMGATGQVAIRQETAGFVDGYRSPDRYMAVISYNFDTGPRVAQNFTTDPDAVKKALNTIQGSVGANPVSAQVGNTKNAGAASKGPPVVTAQAYRVMLASLRSVVDSLSAIRGRKALIFFSGGASISGDLGSALTDTVAACNKANVAIYTVGSGPGGSSSGGGSSSASAGSAPKPGAATSSGRNNPLAADTDTGTTLNSEDSIPLTLSAGTGGVSFLNTNDLANSLGKVAEEQDGYYLLGYTPTVDSAEGTCHDLRLKVDRGDLEVRARKSYCTSKSADPLAGKPAGKDLEARAASGAPGNIAAKMQIPWFYNEPNVAEVKLALDITPAAMKFEKVKGKMHGELDLAGVALKPDGTVAAHFSDTVNLDFDTQQQVDAFLKQPYHYENQLDVAPGDYNLRMSIGSSGQGFGKVEMPLKVDPWNGQALFASAIALSHNAHTNTDLTAGLDGSLLEQRSRPLTANGTEVIPTGTSQFHTGDRGFFYLEAYEPLLKDAKAGAMPVVGLRFRVLDRATSQPKQDSGIKTIEGFMRPGNPVVPIVSPLPTATLPAGAYRLEVTVMRQTGDPVVRTADFDVT
jgi:VWFA-related protein